MLSLRRRYTMCGVPAALLLVATHVGAQSPTAMGTLPSPASRPVLDRPANLVVNAVPLEYALARLTETSGVTVAYSPSLVARERATVSCDCGRVSVDSALGELLLGTPLQYFEIHGQVVIHGAPAPEVQHLPRPVQYAGLPAIGVVATVGSGVRRSAERVVVPPLQFVAGRVLNQRTGEPVVGARVNVEGTDLGTLTESTGAFRIDGVTGDEVTLRVQHIGFRDVVQTVRTGEASLRIMLVESAIRLDEVIVTGTPGGTERRAIANTVSRIDVAEVREFTPATDMTKLIAGRAAGVVVRAGTGAIAGGARITIRGNSSLTLNDQPLIFVDGVRVDNAVGSGPESLGVSFDYGATSRLEMAGRPRRRNAGPKGQPEEFQ